MTKVNTKNNRFQGAESDSENEPENYPENETENEPEMRKQKKKFSSKKLSFIKCLSKTKEARGFKELLNLFLCASKEKQRLCKLFPHKTNPPC